MEYTPPGAVPEPYMQLLPCLLAPVLWERPANIGPLVRLLSAFVAQAAPQIVAQEKLVSYMTYNAYFRRDSKFLNLATILNKSYHFRNIFNFERL